MDAEARVLFSPHGTNEACVAAERRIEQLATALRNVVTEYRAARSIGCATGFVAAMHAAEALLSESSP
jgi:hypothetical protein